MSDPSADVSRRIEAETSFWLTAEYGRNFRRKVSTRTLLRWVKSGVYPSSRLRSDTSVARIKLEAYRDGGSWRTSVEAVHRFRERLGQ